MPPPLCDNVFVAVGTLTLMLFPRRPPAHLLLMAKGDVRLGSPVGHVDGLVDCGGHVQRMRPEGLVAPPVGPSADPLPPVLREGEHLRRLEEAEPTRDVVGVEDRGNAEDVFGHEVRHAAQRRRRHERARRLADCGVATGWNLRGKLPRVQPPRFVSVHDVADAVPTVERHVGVQLYEEVEVVHRPQADKPVRVPLRPRRVLQRVLSMAAAIASWPHPADIAETGAEERRYLQAGDASQHRIPCRRAKQRVAFMLKLPWQVPLAAPRRIR